MGSTVWQKYTDGSQVLAVSIIRAMMTLMMEAASISETSTYIYQSTRRNIPKDSHQHAGEFLDNTFANLFVVYTVLYLI